MGGALGVLFGGDLPAWGRQAHPAEDQRQQGDSDGDSNNTEDGEDALEGILVLRAVAEADPRRLRRLLARFSELPAGANAGDPSHGGDGAVNCAQELVRSVAYDTGGSWVWYDYEDYLEYREGFSMSGGDGLGHFAATMWGTGHVDERAMGDDGGLRLAGYTGSTELDVRRAEVLGELASHGLDFDCLNEGAERSAADALRRAASSEEQACRWLSNISSGVGPVTKSARKLG